MFVIYKPRSEGEAVNGACRGHALGRHAPPRRRALLARLAWIFIFYPEVAPETALMRHSELVLAHSRKWSATVRQSKQ